MSRLLRLVATLLALVPASLPAAPLPTPEAGRTRAALERLEVPFESNVGQYDARVAFAARTFAGTTFVTSAGELVHAIGDASGRRGWSLVESLVDASPSPRGAQASPIGVSRFERGDGSARRRDIPAWRSVSLGEPWAGIALDLAARGANVEKIFTVAAGADPGRIRVAIRGAETLAVDADGALVATTSAGPVRFSAPVAWQDVRGERRAVSVAYSAQGSGYGFRLGEYDRTAPVVIDPVLQATYLGGGSPFDTAFGIGVDAAGNVFVGGGTSSFGFPGTGGGAQPNPNGFDSYVAKLSADLGTLIQASYLGGSSSDAVFALAVDSAGSVYLGGYTISMDYPATAGGAQAATGGNQDGIVIKLANDLKSFVQGTYLGGSGFEQVMAIAIAPNGDVLVAGNTSSPNFPGAAAPARATDAFVARLTADLRTLVRTILLGGSDFDSATSIAVAGDGTILVAGSTASFDFPNVAGGAQPASGGANDAFVARIAADLSAVTQATYLGGTQVDEARAVAVDSVGNVFVAGNTTSTAFPGAAGGAFPANSGSGDSFITRLAPSLGTITQSTYLGAGSSSSVAALAIDNAGFVYSAGSSGPFSASKAVVHKWQPTLKALVQSEVLGSTGSGPGSGATAMARSGTSLLVTGFTAGGIPQASSGAQPAVNGGGDAFIARLALDVVPGPPARYVVSAPSTAGAGQPFLVTVQAFDAANNPVAGNRVHFTSSDATATLPADATVGNPAGTGFMATLSTLGDQTITVGDLDNVALGATSGAIAVGPGPAASFTVTAPASAIAEVPFDFTVTARDAFGNVATAFPARVFFTSTDGAASLPGDNVLFSGTRTFRATLKTVGSQAITARQNNQPGVSGTSGAIAVSEPVVLEATGPAAATAGTPINVTVTARLRSGSVVTSYAGIVHLTSSDGAAVLPADATLTNGTGTFSVTLKTAGNQTVRATDTAVPTTTGVTGAIAVSPAAASALSVVTPPSAVPGTSFGFTVSARDAFGNSTPGYGGTVRFTSSDAGATLPANTALSSGAGSFTATLATLGTQTITATDAANGALTGTSGAISVSKVVPSPTSLDFGGQSMGTTSAAKSVTFTNTAAGPVTIATVTASAQFGVASHDCATLAAGASCTVAVTFTPAAAPGAPGTSVAVSGTLVIAPAGSGGAGITLAGRADRSLVAHYYQSILRRAPDSGGNAFWEGEAARVVALGANVNEVWFAMAQQFYFSPEYLARKSDDTAFVTDLYRTFYNRAPDDTGRDFWLQNLAAGMPREVLLASFMFSPEYAAFTKAIFGDTAARAEVDMVMDFYRGLLARLPDSAGFDYWAKQFRAAQCNGVAYTTALAISTSFTRSSEYLARARAGPQYVGDLYNAFLRRGGDNDGVQFWIGQVAAGVSRDSVRANFASSAEFAARLSAVVDQGCLP